MRKDSALQVALVSIPDVEQTVGPEISKPVLQLGWQLRP
jgi:hypothetical protein